MSEVKLTADSGRTVGSRSSGRLRGEGKIPAVVYGHGIAPISVSIDRKALRAALHTDAAAALKVAAGSPLKLPQNAVLLGAQGGLFKIGDYCFNDGDPDANRRLVPGKIGHQRAGRGVHRGDVAALGQRHPLE